MERSDEDRAFYARLAASPHVVASRALYARLRETPDVRHRLEILRAMAAEEDRRSWESA